jgi:hypothetical protein
MKNLLKIASIIGLTVITQTAYSAAVTDTFETGDTLTAEKLNSIKAAVNDNDTRIDSISSCTAIQGEGSATISCDDNSMASVYDGATATGNVEGDMQYWDGQAWVLVPAPTDTTVESTLRFVNAKPTWAHLYYEIGGRGPAGGFVFYVTDGGLHGLEAAPVDQSEGGAWGCYEDDVAEAIGTAIGTGAQNTEAIVSFECDDGSPAALAATGYELNGYSDWFLPSKDELNMMYHELADTDNSDTNSGVRDAGDPGGFASGYYWSSSQASSFQAWDQSFGNGDQGGYGTKGIMLRVRAVRAF